MDGVSGDWSVTRQKLLSTMCCPAPPATEGSEGTSSRLLCGVPRGKTAIVLQSSSLRPAPSRCDSAFLLNSSPTAPQHLSSLPHWSRVPERGYFGMGASSFASAEHSRDCKEDKSPSDSETFGTCLLSRMVADVSGNAWILSNDTGKPPPHLRTGLDVAPFECIYQTHSSSTRPLGEETRVNKVRVFSYRLAVPTSNNK